MLSVIAACVGVLMIGCVIYFETKQYLRKPRPNWAPPHLGLGIRSAEEVMKHRIGWEK